MNSALSLRPNLAQLYPCFRLILRTKRTWQSSRPASPTWITWISWSIMPASGPRGRSGRPTLEARKIHRLHVMATVRLTHAALGKMVRRDGGGIINVASVSAFLRVSGNASYAATKSWMTSFTEGLYLELKSAGSAVKVQALCPGFTYSEFHDVMHVDRKSMAPPPLWMNAEFVVAESLRCLRKGKLYVVPGWRYRAIVALISKLPTSLRLVIEKAASRTKNGRGPSQE